MYVDSLESAESISKSIGGYYEKEDEEIYIHRRGLV